MTYREETDSRLLQEIVAPLTKSGIIAGTLVSGTRRWEGIARIPKSERYGTTFIFEDSKPGLAGVRDKTGTFRKLTLT